MSDSDIQGALQQTLGGSAASVSHIKLGPGVLGRAGYIVAIAVVCLAPALFHSTLGPFALGAIILFVLAYLGLAVWFGIKHPGPALLGGADLIAWRQMDIAAMNTPIVEDARPVPNPVLAPPAEESNVSAEQ